MSYDGGRSWDLGNRSEKYRVTAVVMVVVVERDSPELVGVGGDRRRVRRGGVAVESASRSR